VITKVFRKTKIYDEYRQKLIDDKEKAKQVVKEIEDEMDIIKKYLDDEEIVIA
jgi:hypothetical protein